MYKAVMDEIYRNIDYIKITLTMGLKIFIIPHLNFVHQD
jgi:hypothetical protein